MIRISRIALSLVLIPAMALSLFACSSSEPEAPPAAAPSMAEAEESAADAPVAMDRLALLSACNVELSEPSSVEWDTKWDPAYARNMSQHPSGVRSAHWANEEELAQLQQSNRAYPLEVSCGSDAGSEYTILVEMVAARSSLTDMPMESGNHPIVPAAGDVKPGDIVVGNLQFNGTAFQAQGGNLSVERFDSEGAAGNFVIEGRETGGENRPIRIEGTFDMPCRFDRMQRACTSDKAERE